MDRGGRKFGIRKSTPARRLAASLGLPHVGTRCDSTGKPAGRTSTYRSFIEFVSPGEGGAEPGRLGQRRQLRQGPRPGLKRWATHLVWLDYERSVDHAACDPPLDRPR